MWGICSNPTLIEATSPAGLRTPGQVGGPGLVLQKQGLIRQLMTVGRGALAAVSAPAVRLGMA